MLIHRSTTLCLLVTALAVVAPADAEAQRGNPTKQELKAAFLYNFTKFTDWPPEALPPAAPVILCIAADPKVQTALETLAKGTEVRGHPVEVRAVELEAGLATCHLLYAENLDVKRTLQLLKQLSGAPVLAVSDFKQFAQLGGTAQLFTEGARMRFAVNLEAVQRSKIRMRSTLLSLAKIVKDDPALLDR